MRTINYEREKQLLELPQARKDSFWHHIISTGFCWRWQPRNGRYGRFQVGGGKIQAHRCAWLLTHGAIPVGLEVLHRCDHPRCVNPAHLFLGTQSDNMKDCARKQRQWLQKNPERSSLHQWNLQQVVITAEDLPVIKELYGSFGMTMAQIATLFDCSRSLISLVLSGKRTNFFTAQEIEELSEIN